jgi:hypothetical protein
VYLSLNNIIMGQRIVLSENEKQNIRKLYLERSILLETVHTATSQLKHTLTIDQFNNVKSIMDLNILVKGEVKGNIRCGETKKFQHSESIFTFDIQTTLNCDTNQLSVSVDASDTVWNAGGDTSVVVKLTDQSAQGMSTNGVTINGKSPSDFNISMTINQMKSNPRLEPIQISVGGDAAAGGTENGNQNTNNTSNISCADKFNEKYKDSFKLGGLVKGVGVVDFTGDNQKDKRGDYWCSDADTINLTHFKYDNDWDYRLTLDTSGVKKVLTKRKKNTDWIDVTNKEQFKNPILTKVFKITE